MDIGVPSRFACLNIEDEELPTSNFKPKEPKKKSKKTIAEPPKLTNSKKIEKPATKKADLKPASASSKKNKKKQPEQWEDSEQTDDEVRNGNGHFEEDLHNAILLSKLDYEKNPSKKRGEAEACKPDSKKKAKKSKANNLYTLRNHECDKQANKVSSSTKLVNAKPSEVSNSCNRMIKITRAEQLSEKRIKPEASTHSVISLDQYQELYEEEHRLRLAAEEELKYVKVKLESAEAKVMLSKMIRQGQLQCTISSASDSEHPNKKNNLINTSELQALLEKERAKVAALTAALNNSSKPKQKKRKGN